MRNKVKLFAWDFHGTLEQGTEVGFTELLKELAKSIKYDAKIELEEVRKLYGSSILDYLKHFFPEYKNEEIIILRNKIRSLQSEKHLKDFIKPALYAHEVLSKIQDEGHKNIIVSTSSQKHIKRFLGVIKVTKYLDAIFGIDRHSLDSKFDIAKEKSKVIRSFAQSHKIDPSRIIVIGDRAGDIDAGILIGAKTYQYIQPHFENVKTKADFKIRDLREILKEI